MKELAIKAKFVALRAQGHSFASISKELNTAKSTLIQWSRIYFDEIRAMRDVEDEILLESYNIGKKHRIALLSGMLERLKEKINDVDLSQLPAERLIDITLKLSETLKKEEHFVEFR